MDTLTKIKEIISEEMDIAIDSLDEGTTLDEVSADSLDLVELLMALEDAFDMEIPDEDAEKFKNIGDISRYIEDKM